MSAPAGYRGDGGGRLTRADFTIEREHAGTVPVATPARWPRPGTRAAEALAALLAGPKTQADLLGQGWRLAASIEKLRACGWVILTRWVQPSNVRIAQYCLDRQHPTNAAALAQRGGTR